ncbi:VWA-like domain-containing protein [Nicoliella spurrieriana]|uniref:VWA-like domain-containing protein n=1 Tax=Nicoliella spurrieriana TaxID=2925830 RepID=A0A976RRP5_9LACO|nr:VWA-like domain-containing protein [Nicoliella spurrieriana]UQS86628.1 VWA-like domain-containing protein [Nicoliella spurrieriana]
MDVASQLARLQEPTGNKQQLIDSIVGGQIIKIEQTSRFYGEVLLQLPRHFATLFNGALGIGWLDHQIELLINPDRFINADLTVDQLDSILRQVALHLSFGHPLMYPRADTLNQLACDIVVDQYLGRQSANTLDQLNFQLGSDLAADMGSHYYLTQLRKLKPRGNRSAATVARQMIQAQTNQHDSHAGWQQFGDQERPLQQGKLRQLINLAWQQTPDKQRGTLPGNVVANLTAAAMAPKINNWRQLLKVGLGTTPFGRLESRARFNRRQAYRMELSGKVSDTVRRINLFIDNSGSMGDSEITDLLNEIGHFLSQESIEVTIYSFDSQVHFNARYLTSNAQQLHYQRIGGGGTSFQAIFHFLNQHRSKLIDTLTIIMTDGKGEKQLNDYGFKNVVWILTTSKRDFSLIEHYPGTAVSIDRQIN